MNRWRTVSNRYLGIEIENSGHDNAENRSRIAQGRKMVSMVNCIWWSEELTEKESTEFIISLQRVFKRTRRAGKGRKREKENCGSESGCDEKILWNFENTQNQK